MGEVIVGAVIGVIVGWNLPQPVWAQDAQAWVVAKWREFRD